MEIEYYLSIYNLYFYITFQTVFITSLVKYYSWRLLDVNKISTESNLQVPAQASRVWDFSFRYEFFWSLEKVLPACD